MLDKIALVIGYLIMGCLALSALIVLCTYGWQRLRKATRRNWFAYYVSRKYVSNERCLMHYKVFKNTKGRYAARFRLRNIRSYQIRKVIREFPDCDNY